MSELQKKLIRLPQAPRFTSRAIGPKDYSPVHYAKYFDEKDLVSVPDVGTFCVYKHSNTSEPDVPVVLFIHGGGYSGLTWARTVEKLMTLVECKVIAVDLRGHGETTTTTDNDLSTDVLVEDLIKLAEAMKIDQSQIVVVGHSLGGALAIHFSSKVLSEGKMNVVGLVVIDVVEGSALDALSGMSQVLRSRPSKFETMPKAIEWCVRSGQTRDLDSAKISMPGQLKNCESNKPATLDIKAEEKVKTSPKAKESPPKRVLNLPVIRTDAILEDEEEGCDKNNTKFVAPIEISTGYSWRIDLYKTQPYWTGWFQGISSKFLQVPCPKLLLLAGIDRLDRDLTVGQMQGKFQMQVLPNVGHAVQEDSPLEVANSLASFLVRHKFAISKGNVAPTYPGC